MDTITHGLCGAAIGIALSPAKVQRRVVIVSAVLATLPDADLFFRGLLQHRAETHAFFYLALSAPFFALIGKKIIGAEISWWRIFIITLLALFSHALVDLLNAYGTNVWLPFSAKRVAIGALPIIDLLFSLPLLLPVFYLARKNFRYQKSLAISVLCWCALYVFVGKYFATQAQKIFATAHPENTLHANPCLGTTLIWRCVSLNHHEIIIGYVDVLRARIISVEKRVSENNDEITNAKKLPAVQKFFTRANDLVCAQQIGEVIYFRDLRYGFLSVANSELFTLTVDLTTEPPQTSLNTKSPRDLTQAINEFRAIFWAIIGS